MRFDRQQFWSGYRDKFGSASQQQVDGLTFILDAAEKDSRLQRIEDLGYMLGTTKHETGDTFQPIHEYGSHAYFVKRYGSQTAVGKRLGNKTAEDGATYSGEGDVQLTGLGNFTKAESAIRREYPEIVADFEARTGRKFDLTVGDQPNDSKDPQNAGDPAIAYAIMSYGMRVGMFTGRKLSDYNLATVSGRVSARHIINGTDKASLIARYAAEFIDILKSSLVPAAVAPSLVPDDASVVESGTADSSEPQAAPDETETAPPPDPSTVQQPDDFARLQNAYTKHEDVITHPTVKGILGRAVGRFSVLLMTIWGTTTGKIATILTAIGVSALLAYELKKNWPRIRNFYASVKSWLWS